MLARKSLVESTVHVLEPRFWDFRRMFCKNHIYNVVGDLFILVLETLVCPVAICLVVAIKIHLWRDYFYNSMLLNFFSVDYNNYAAFKLKIQLFSVLLDI